VKAQQDEIVFVRHDEEWKRRRWIQRRS